MGGGGIDNTGLVAGGVVTCICMGCLFTFGVPMFFGGITMLVIGNQECWGWDIGDYYSSCTDESYYQTVGGVLLGLSLLLLVTAIILTVLAFQARGKRKNTTPQGVVLSTTGTATYGSTVQPQPSYYQPPQQPGYGQPPQQPGYWQPPSQSGYMQAQQPQQPQSMPGYVPPGAAYTPYPPQQQSYPPPTAVPEHSAPPPTYESVTAPSE